jgi:hypothetical protein
MTLSSDAPPTFLPVGVRIYDRPVDCGVSLALRLDRARVWCDERELHIVEEHVADGPYDPLDVLGQAATLCRDTETPLIVWDIRWAVGDDMAVRRLLRALGDVVLVDAHRSDRLMPASHGLILPVATPWPILRWKPAPARHGGVS